MEPAVLMLVVFALGWFGVGGIAAGSGRSFARWTAFAVLLSPLLTLFVLLVMVILDAAKPSVAQS